MELVTPRMINTPLEGEVTEYIEYVRLFIRSFTNSPLQRNLRWFFVLIMGLKMSKAIKLLREVKNYGKKIFAR